MAKQRYSSSIQQRKSLEKASNYAAKNTPKPLQEEVVNQTEHTDNQ